MAVFHDSKSDLIIKIEEEKNKHMKSICKATLLTAMLSIPILIFLSDSTYNTICSMPLTFWTVLYTCVHPFLYIAVILLFPYLFFCLIKELFFYRSNDLRIIESGIHGETKAREVFSELDDSFHVFNNIQIPYKGGLSETDIIIIGPTGIFITEVKNFKGFLENDWKQHDLKLHRTYDSDDSRIIYNPIRQVGTHVFRLAGYLREHNIDKEIKGLVYFTNPDLDYSQMTDCENKSLHKIYNDGNRLKDYINSQPKVLNEKEITRILHSIELLKK